ncbi:MAG: HAMP domain-containing sensor histidine kinase [Treponema sp.]
MSLDVFKKLKIKISVSITAVLAIVLAVLIGSLNFYLTKSNKKVATQFINQLVENDGRRIGPNGSPMNIKPDWKPNEKNMNMLNSETHPVPPDKPEMENNSNGVDKNMNAPRMEDRMPPELEPQQNDGLFKWIPFKTNYMGFRNFYTAKIDSYGKLFEVVNKFSDNYEETNVDELVKKIFSLKKNRGTYGYFEYDISQKKYGYLIVILDMANEISQEKNFGFVSLLIYGLSLLVAFGLAWAFALWSLKPVQEAFIKQKQFIADASHELKTPIAVIGANIDVLEQDMPNNKWIQYIKTENLRMGDLVKNLLYLAKNDAGREKFTMLPFDLGDAAACAVLPFESVAFEQGKKLEINIPKDPITVTGEESKIKQVIIILTDNALKNSEKGAVIKITAGFENSKRYVRVYNTGHGIAPEDIDKIFNRFYRVDTSRDRNTGGYGLGLAIAQTIAKAHGGQIAVQSELGKYAQFTLLLPSAIKESKHSKRKMLY